MLPFTHAEFVDVFARYNLAIWPGQLVAYALGLGMVGLLLARPSRGTGRAVAIGLALMWGWTGVAYHWLYFTEINAAAWAFGALFVLQAGLFAEVALSGALRFDGGVTAGRRSAGWFLVVYALVLYPLLGMATGSTWPHMPVFGVTPCPVTLFTFGLLLLNTAPVPRRLLVIPVLWSLVGGSAAWLLQVPQDWLLLLSGASVFLLARKPLAAAAARARG
jgi:hypothetical protein